MSDVSSSESLQGSFSLDDTVGTNTLFVLQFPLEVICFQMLYLFIYLFIYLSWCVGNWIVLSFHWLYHI